MKFIKKFIAKNGDSYFWYPDGKKHEKEYFSCEIPTWKCTRCGCKYGVIGISMTGCVEKGSLIHDNKEKW